MCVLVFPLPHLLGLGGRALALAGAGLRGRGEGLATWEQRRQWICQSQDAGNPQRVLQVSKD
jgi:hypothetical protein